MIAAFGVALFFALGGPSLWREAEAGWRGIIWRVFATSPIWLMGLMEWAS